MLNENIKILRKQKGYTQETLAQELNVVRQTVSKWEKGYSVPDAVMLEKISELFEVSVAEILGNAEEQFEDKTDIKQISEQLTILNNQFARELARKRKNRKIALVILSVIAVVVIFFLTFVLFPIGHTEIIDSDTDGTESNGISYTDIDGKLDKTISDVIMENNNGDYFSGEFQTESHFIFDKKEKDGIITVYLLENYSEFGFINGYFVPVSGGTTPAVFTFRKDGEDYSLISSRYAEDGSHYTSSIKEMFPEKTAAKVIKGLSDEESNMMRIKQIVRAQDYLSSIGREAIICEYSDIYTDFLSNYGIENDITDKIADSFPDYDFSIGNHEKIENGKRFVYQTDYDRQNNRITFTKFEYDTNNIAEFTAVDGTNGQVIENAPKPQTVKYKKGRLSDSSRDTQYTTIGYYG